MFKTIIMILSASLILSCSADNSSISADSIDKKAKKVLEDNYLKVDTFLETLQSYLPSQNNAGTTWLSAHREGNTVIYTFKEKRLTKDNFDMKKQKELMIEKIRNNPRNLGLNMDFKFVHIFQDGQKAQIKVTPGEYMEREGSQYSDGNEISELLVTKIGVIGLIVLGMTKDEIDQKGIQYVQLNDPQNSKGKSFYLIESHSIEFEMEKKKINRLWFYAKNHEFTFYLPLDQKIMKLNRIGSNDIVRNYGPVEKYVSDKQKKIKGRKAVWAKYSPSGVDINHIYYPELPFSFGLNNNDTVTCVTVSN